MKSNVGTSDRLLRVIAALVMLACAVMAPLPLVVRVGALGVPGGYLLLTALIGSCAGYALMGRSTCRLEARR